MKKVTSLKNCYSLKIIAFKGGNIIRNRNSTEIFTLEKEPLKYDAALNQPGSNVL
jgi:hypothetical protein